IPIGLAVVTLTLCLWQAQMTDVTFSVPAATLIVGFVLAGLFALLVYLAQTANRSAREVEAANQGLKQQISVRQQAEERLQRRTDDLRRRTEDLRCRSDDLRRTLETIREAVVQLTSSSAEILASTTAQAQGATQEAAA